MDVRREDEGEGQGNVTKDKGAGPTVNLKDVTEHEYEDKGAGLGQRDQDKGAEPTIIHRTRPSTTEHHRDPRHRRHRRQGRGRT